MKEFEVSHEPYSVARAEDQHVRFVEVLVHGPQKVSLSGQLGVDARIVVGVLENDGRSLGRVLASRDSGKPFDE